MGVEASSPQTIQGRNGGTLTPFQPGSNGDVHRGPDRQLRINVVRGILLDALAKEGVRLVIGPAGAPSSPSLEDPHGVGHEPRHPDSGDRIHRQRQRHPASGLWDPLGLPARQAREEWRHAAAEAGDLRGGASDALD